MKRAEKVIACVALEPWKTIAAEISIPSASSAVLDVASAKSARFRINLACDHDTLSRPEISANRRAFLPGYASVSRGTALALWLDAWLIKWESGSRLENYHTRLRHALFYILQQRFKASRQENSNSALCNVLSVSISAQILCSAYTCHASPALRAR
jgi:hypothetical protein